MTCRQIIEFLSDYRDQALPDDERRRFEAHLRDCPECRRYVHQFDTTVELTKSLGDTSANLPEELVHAILKSVRASARR